MKGFIKIDYTGKTEEGVIFETTSKTIAAKAGISPQGKKFEPKIIKVGEHQILAGLDKHLMELEIGKHKIILPPEEAFGKKSTKLLKLVPKRILKEHNINPYVGQVLEIDGTHGIVRVASGGRIIVDFNHPIAGKNVEYDIEIIKEVKDLKEQAQGMMELMGIAPEGIELEEKKIKILFKEKLPEPVEKMIVDEMKRLLETDVVLEKAKA